MCAAMSFKEIVEKLSPDTKWEALEVDSPASFEMARQLHASLISEVNQCFKQSMKHSYDQRLQDELMQRVMKTAPQGLTPSLWKNISSKLLMMAKRAIDREDELAYKQHLLEMDSDGLMREVTDNVMAMIALSKGRPDQARAFRDSFRRTGLGGGSMNPRSKLLALTDIVRRENSARAMKLSAVLKGLMTENSDKGSTNGSRVFIHDRVRAIAFKDGRGRREEGGIGHDDDREANALDVLGGREGSSRLRSIKMDLTKSTFKHYLSKRDAGSLTKVCEEALVAAIEVDSPAAASAIIDLLAASEISQELRLGGLNLNAKTSYVLHRVLPHCRHLKELHIVRSAIPSTYAGLILPMMSVLPLTSVSIVEADIRRESLVFILAAFSRPTETSAVNPSLSALSRPPRSSSPAGDIQSPQPGSPGKDGPGLKYMTGMAPNWWLTLRSFDLSHNASVGDEGFSQLVPCFIKLHNLRLLKLAGVGISDTSASNIRELLTLSEIESLDLSSNAGLKANAAKAIAAALSDTETSKRLKELQLNLNEGLYSFVSTIIWSYTSWVSLEHLGLAGVRLHEDDKMTIACMLRYSGVRLCLKHLDLSRAGDLTTVSGQCLMRQMRARKDGGSKMTIETQGCKTAEENSMPSSEAFQFDMEKPENQLILKILAEHEVTGRRQRFNTWTRLRIDYGPDLISSATWRGVEHEGWMGSGLPKKGKVFLSVLPLPFATE